jgi:hypothetical protein
MNEETLSKEYFDWMYNLVCDKRKPYHKLLTYLHQVEFTYTLPMDDNRYVDGVDLRYRFAYDCGHHPAMIAEYLDNRPCSVLEMMVALVYRFEEQITDDPAIGDRKKRWFMAMIRSLDLLEATDANFDERVVGPVIARFLNRDYAPNGKGGLFTVNSYRRDMRLVDIWYQMCWYLDEVLQRRTP